MKKTGIAIAGNLICDSLHTIDTYPRIGRLTKVRSIERNVGGACNLILDLAKIDSSLPLKISGTVGDDSAGTYILDVLKSYPNIDTKNVTIEGDSSQTLVMDAQDSNQRTFFFYPGVGDSYNASYIDWEHLQAKMFHLEYLLLMKEMDAKDSEYGTQAARVLKKAQELGMKTSIDAVTEESERAAAVIQSVLPYTDYCILNELEAENATGIKLIDHETIIEESIWQALDFMKRSGVSTWAVIHSKYWNFGLDIVTGNQIKLPSLKLPSGFIKGTTGAGDAFCCGILYGAYQEMSLEEAIRLGIGCAACSLSSLSGTDGMRAYEKVQALYQELSD